MKRSRHAVLAVSLVLGILALPLGVVVLASSTVVAELGAPSTAQAAGSLGGEAVPALWRQIEQDASARCLGLSWATLGALGFLSTGSGRWSDRPPPWWPAPGGAFGVELPGATSLAADAARAVDSLCTAQRSAGSLTAGLIVLTGRASFAVDVEVLGTALSSDAELDAGHAQAIVFAAEALGTPYRWGGNGPDSYDCSGLVVAAWRAGGRSLPRTAQEQFDATSRGLGVPSPGDLVFFGTDQRSIVHVGIEVGEGLMIDAPYTGADVRIDPDGLARAVGIGLVS